MKKIFYITILCLLLLPLLVSAKIEFKLSQNMPDMPTPCEYIKFLYLWGLGIVGALAVVVIAIGGFFRIVGKAEKGTELINSALIGLVMVFASWLILNTINPDLAKLKCDLPALSAPTTGAPPSAPGAPPGAAPTPTVAPDQTIYDQITQATGGKVTVNGRCTDSSQCIQGRTCLNGLQSSTINGIIDMQKACNCSFVLTGGTEACHETSGTFNHPNGFKADIRPGNEIGAYIYSQIGTFSPTPNKNYRGIDNNTYRFETNHWDVCYKCL
ncbi:MAG: hypothetical protein A2174_02085 [Candidatus Portnoybacteria bacterium RBG_13_41_18]|uniref:Uncharacterized protein n=1 Tax=Candidatus Portnoybacteria bacterium RBG_13_41_18 TaxID=1801991 RepID=A0A1G2F724_9BACT|nr:MAG: hypothetical protein A2174_02085 [Candidatus Portnoybacteria bacterium RBG_13_41_18]